MEKNGIPVDKTEKNAGTLIKNKATNKFTRKDLIKMLILEQFKNRLIDVNSVKEMECAVEPTKNENDKWCFLNEIKAKLKSDDEIVILGYYENSGRAKEVLAELVDILKQQELPCIYQMPEE